jgi:hypothetical protein
MLPDQSKEPEKPLIYTSKGNVPIDGLQVKTTWDFDEQGITFAEEYYDADDGLVKRSAHRFQFPEGTKLNLQQGDLS